MSYEVWRRDDNGNDFLVAADLPQSEAQKLVDDLTARGHKQMYWMIETRDSQDLEYLEDLKNLKNKVDDRES